MVSNLIIPHFKCAVNSHNFPFEDWYEVRALLLGKLQRYSDALEVILQNSNLMEAEKLSCLHSPVSACGCNIENRLVNLTSY